MPLILDSQIPTGSAVPVDLSPVVPELLCDQTLPAIGQTRVFCGKHETPLAELFNFSGTPADGQLELRGDLSSVHRIGAGMAGGTIRIEGSVGRHLGAEMRAGQIEVSGDAGDWVGAEMRGGRIHVRGSVGDHAGSAYPGSRRGMSGGEILIDGDAGAAAGEAMRRGIIAIQGSAGGDVGARMIAGTILIGGDCGPKLAVGLRRGTIVLTARQPIAADQILPLTFVQGNQWNPPFLRLLSVHLQQVGISAAAEWIGSAFTVYHGDRLALGKGEIFVRAQA